MKKLLILMGATALLAGCSTNRDNEGTGGMGNADQSHGGAYGNGANPAIGDGGTVTPSGQPGRAAEDGGNPAGAGGAAGGTGTP